MISAAPIYRSLVFLTAIVRSLAFVNHRPSNSCAFLATRMTVPTTTRRTTTITTTTTTARSLSSQDEAFLLQAVEHAKNGLGHTFPNPIVGCVLVRQDTMQAIGAGFHPQSGMPHAEVFALLEAAGHVTSGVEAAKSVIKKKLNHDRDNIDNNSDDNSSDQTKMEAAVRQLADTYASTDGPARLFGNGATLVKSNSDHPPVPFTAYVTLEPCCHHGQTPPCAASLVLAKADRVVIGFRDPNPRVNGGGVKLLEDAGVTVDLATTTTTTTTGTTTTIATSRSKAGQACAAIVTDFVKRITPRDDWESNVTGAKRSALRSLAGRKKANGTLAEIPWGGDTIELMISKDSNTDMQAAVEELTLDASWLEHVDGVLWKNELVGLRLGKAVKKSKGAKLLGERIARHLQAHVAQTVGHTCLLYRPGIPQVLNLDEMLTESTTSSSITSDTASDTPSQP